MLRFFCFVVLAGLCSAAPPRVAVVVEAPDGTVEWQAVLTATLSTNEVLQVVERAELQRILEEQARRDLVSGGKRTTAHLEPVDYFLHFRRSDGRRWRIEAVDASTGHLVAATEARGETLEEAGAVAAVAADLLEKRSSPDAGECRVAVAETAAGDPRVFMLAARLRDALRESDILVLDRALTQRLVEEKSDAEKGWRAAVPEAVFFGTDYLVELGAEGEECALRVVRTRDGRLIASRRFAWDGAGAIDGIRPWLLPFLGRADRSPGPYLPSVEIEALEPFYRGLKLFDAGKYAEATAEFTTAFLRNGKFREAMLWEARCYDALGFGPLAEAMRGYAETGLVGSSPSASGRVSAAEALAFLGVGGEPAAVAVSLSALAASALAAREDREVQLPEHLGRLRREYDWMAGLARTEGVRWEQSPSLFCRTVLRGRLQVEEGHPVIVWTLGDTVSGRTFSAGESRLSPDPSHWSGEMEVALDKVFSEVSTDVTSAHKETASVDVAQLARDVVSLRGLEANVALLKLAQADPGHPLVGARTIEKGQSKRDGLDVIMEFALRDWVIAQLPPGHPRRRWSELMRLYAFEETKPIGRLATGRKIDFVAELETFAELAPRDPPGLMARYSVLYERQGDLPPAELADECERLLSDLAASAVFPGREKLEVMTTALRDFARIAAGDRERDFPAFSHDRQPKRISLKWQDDGQPEIVKLSRWAANEYDWVDLRPEERAGEARAILTINGRPGERRKVPDRWLTDHPRSIVLAAFVISALHELNFWHGKPLVHALDWPSEREAFLNLVSYAGETLEYWICRAERADKLENVENLVWSFLMALNERVFLDVLSDREYDALRDRLAAAMEQTNRRLGRSGWAMKQRRLISWQEVTRAQSWKLHRDHLNEVGLEIYDRTVLAEEIAQAESAAHISGDFDPKPWWQRLRGQDIWSAFTASELAAFTARKIPDVLRRSESRAPTGEERASWLEMALALFYGGNLSEAERMFRLVLDAPEGGNAGIQDADVLRANAAFRLAQILRLSGRLPEAIKMARRGLEICGPTSWDLIGRLYSSRMQRDLRQADVTGILASHLTRLLLEMRVDPERVKLPPPAGVVTVPTPNADNPRLRVFYRVPSGGPDKKIPRRVLVLVPSLNHDVLEYLEPTNPWAQFADRMGWVLVCPQFYASERFERADHLFCYYLHPQVWSGRALQGALQEIAKKVSIRQDGLLLHGYGAGAGFVARLARWKPDLVSAVSCHGGGVVLPWFQAYPGLEPIAAMKDVRFFVSAGELDDYARTSQNRAATAEALVTVLRGAGVSTDWRLFPEVGHMPTEEMEEMARKFLEKNHESD